MRIFQEVPLPPTCYVAEAALWVALGRVPQILVKVSDIGEDYSQSDPRTNFAAFDEDDRLLWFDPGFSQSELNHMGVQVDWDLYERTKNLVSEEFPYLNKPSGDEVVEAYLSREHYMVELGAKSKMHEDARVLTAMKEGVDWANKIDSQCDAIIDIARAEVFKALAKGTLSGLGWRRDTEHKRGAERPLVKIPASHWSMRNFDWEDSELHHSSGEYFAVQVSTAEMLAHFPRPQCEPIATTLDLYPSCILAEDDGAGSKLAPALRPPRGRTAKGGGIIRSVVQNYFGHRLRKGEDMKGEALIQEVIDFVAIAFPGETISRSTVQDYLKAIRPTEDKAARADAGYHAGNSAGK